MAILHLVKCDRVGCDVTAPLQASQDEMVRAQTTVGNTSWPIPTHAPQDWLRVGGRDFCSWACVGAYAREKAG